MGESQSMVLGQCIVDMESFGTEANTVKYALGIAIETYP